MEKESTDVSNQKEMVLKTNMTQNITIAFTDVPNEGFAYSYFSNVYPEINLDKVEFTHSFIDDLGYVAFNYSVETNKETMRG